MKRTHANNAPLATILIQDRVQLVQLAALNALTQLLVLDGQQAIQILAPVVHASLARAVISETQQTETFVLHVVMTAVLARQVLVLVLNA